MSNPTTEQVDTGLEELICEVVFCTGSCAMQADPADGGGYCSCGASKDRERLRRAIAQEVQKASDIRKVCTVDTNSQGQDYIRFFDGSEPCYTLADFWNRLAANPTPTKAGSE